MGKLKKRAQKPSKPSKLAKLIARAKEVSKTAPRALCVAIQGNKLALIQLSLLSWLTYRVELIYATVNGLLNLVITIGLNVLISLQGARDQFEAAIRSILSLFGGDGA